MGTPGICPTRGFWGHWGPPHMGMLGTLGKWGPAPHGDVGDTGDIRDVPHMGTLETLGTLGMCPTWGPWGHWGHWGPAPHGDLGDIEDVGDIRDVPHRGTLGTLGTTPPHGDAGDTGDLPHMGTLGTLGTLWRGCPHAQQDTRTCPLPAEPGDTWRRAVPMPPRERGLSPGLGTLGENRAVPTPTVVPPGDRKCPHPRAVPKHPHCHLHSATVPTLSPNQDRNIPGGW